MKEYNKYECMYCGQRFFELQDGLIPYHDYPKFCRMICKGAKMEPLDMPAKLTEIKGFICGLMDNEDIYWTRGEARFLKEMVREADTIKEERDRLLRWKEMLENAPAGVKDVVTDRFLFGERMKPFITAWKDKVSQLEDLLLKIKNDPKTDWTEEIAKTIKK